MQLGALLGSDLEDVLQSRFLSVGAVLKRRFNVITCEGLLQVLSKVLIVRQYYPQGRVRLFIRTRSFGFANGERVWSMMRRMWLRG